MNKIFEGIDFYLLVTGFMFTLFIPILGLGFSIASGYYALKNNHKTILISAIVVGMLALTAWIAALTGV